MKPRFVVVLLVACGGSRGGTDIEPTLQFAACSDEEILRLVYAAQGIEIFVAANALLTFDSWRQTDPDPCPAIAISGNTVSLTGGCTTRDMITIEGSGAITNAGHWF